MKVLINKGKGVLFAKGKIYKKGEEYDLSEFEAKALISNNLATKVVASKKETKDQTTNTK